jgi:orotidine-5'-phosphate decarboxylase
MAETFGDRLIARSRERGSLCVGIDPSTAHLQSWGRDDDPVGLEFAALQLLEAAIDAAVAIKPQVAYFERFGAAGYRVLERLFAEARAADLLIVADAKRGDIGSTNDGYAQAWLRDGAPLAADALTVAPYLGLGAMGTLLTACRSSSRGLFVVVSSSNPEGRLVQTARTADGESVEDALLGELAQANRGEGFGPFGAVVGATRSPSHFRYADVRGPFLVPGVGAQGATPQDVARLFVGCVPGSVLVPVSRALASVGPERRALIDATRRLRDEIDDAFGG